MARLARRFLSHLWPPATTDTDQFELGVDRMCVLCLEREKDVAMLPCEHVATCAPCAAVAAKCPICSTHKTLYIKVLPV